MERLRPLMIVSDDGGSHPAIIRGTRVAAENKAISCVDYMIEASHAVQVALSLHQEFPNISIGLHVDPFQMNDYETTALAYWCRWQPNKLFQQQVTRAAEYQISKFQDKFGHQPSHLSIQNNMHLDHHNNPFPWFADLISKLSEGNISKVLVRGIHTKPIRHIRFRELLLGKNPLTPVQFQLMLRNISFIEDKAVELVVHPAKRGENFEPSLKAFYTTKLREQDLTTLLNIIRDGAIEGAGYYLVSPDELIKTEHKV